jgi:hypothetical protein
MPGVAEMISLVLKPAIPKKVMAIARLGAITRSGDDALLGLEQTARRLGETTQFSASEAASAMTFLGMARWALLAS